MIRRHYTEGQKLNVADLNEINVLVDRSETTLTEVARNTWPAGINGPPHSHEAKEQIFYITSGEGRIIVGGDEFAVKPGSLVFVPRGVVHQTIASEEAPLCYFLFNAFLDPAKEGHATFADHISKVKETRRKQAATGNSNVGPGAQSASSKKPGKHVGDIRKGKFFDFGANTATLLLDRSETEGSELALVTWPKGNKGPLVAHAEKEQTFFVLEGRGKVTVGEETKEVQPGDVAFVPWNTPHTTEAVGEELTYLCFNTLTTKTKEGSFADMYQRVGPQRIARWKSGNTAVGE